MDFDKFSNEFTNVSLQRIKKAFQEALLIDGKKTALYEALPDIYVAAYFFVSGNIRDGDSNQTTITEFRRNSARDIPSGGADTIKMILYWLLIYWPDVGKQIDAKIFGHPRGRLEADETKYRRASLKDMAARRQATTQSKGERARSKPEADGPRLLPLGDITLAFDPMPGTTDLDIPWRSRSGILVDGNIAVFAALNWKHRLTALQGRDDEKRSILEWARLGEENISVRLLTGPGGSGKTRLAAEVATELQAADWSAGFLRERHFRAPLIVRDKGIFMVIDAPEERSAAVTRILDEIESSISIPSRVRILLVSRRSFEAWREQPEVFDLGTTFGMKEIAQISTLSTENCVTFIEEAAKAFAAETSLRVPNLVSAGDWLSVSAKHKEPLNLIAAAIHAVYSGTGDFNLGGSDLMKELAKIELRRIKAAENSMAIGSDKLSTILGLASLSANGVSSETILQIKTERGEPLIDEKALFKIKSSQWWSLNSSIEDAEPARLLKPEPSRPAAALLALSVLRSSPGKLEQLISPIAISAGTAFGEILSRVCFDLTQIHQNYSKQLQSAAEEMVILHPERASYFYTRSNLSLSTYAAEFELAVLRNYAHLASRTEEVANIYFQISTCLRKLGDLEQAKKFSQLSLDKISTVADEELYMNTAAMAGQYFQNHSGILFESGQPSDALEAAQRAKMLFDTLYCTEPTRYAEGLARSHQNLSAISHKIENWPQCEAHALRALRLIRDHLNMDDFATQALLAECLRVLGIGLMDSGSTSAAQEPLEQSVEYYRALSARRPEVYQTALAHCLTDLRDLHTRRGEFDEALPYVAESIDRFREADLTSTGAYYSNLSINYEWLTVYYVRLRDLDKAREYAREKRELLQRAAELFPDEFELGREDAID